MTPTQIITPILCIALLTVALLKWRHCRIERKARAFISSLAPSDGPLLSSVMSYSLSNCRTVFNSVLDAILSADKVEICRLHRTFGSEYDKFDHYHRNLGEKDRRDNIYIAYMWEATMKLAESGRKMIVNPDYDCHMPEVEALKEWKGLLPDVGSANYAALAEQCRLNKDKITEDIRVYTHTMRHSDYDEDSRKYNYLSFLSFLYSFMMSLDNLMKPYRTARL